MSDWKGPPVGTICWRDLTVHNAESVRDFYAEVVGWKYHAEDMGGYHDFSMLAPETGETVAGICHPKGANTNLPPQWLVYIIVEDVEQSAERCKQLGGDVIAGPGSMAGGRFCVIRDPAWAVCALFEPPREDEEPAMEPDGKGLLD